ncbi:hypothetical protein BC830DRAFT_405463 [Chytriomyces sp. MP71]|nr:hypothetical protein BC830DRAFT_405463 [Chytriomyces sp. MP71]
MSDIPKRRPPPPPPPSRRTGPLSTSSPVSSPSATHASVSVSANAGPPPLPSRPAFQTLSAGSSPPAAAIPSLLSAGTGVDAGGPNGGGRGAPPPLPPRNSGGVAAGGGLNASVINLNTGGGSGAGGGVGLAGGGPQGSVARHAPSLASDMPRDLPAPHPSALPPHCIEAVHRGAMRAFAFANLRAVSVGEKHLRVYSMAEGAREVGVFSFSNPLGTSTSPLNSVGGSMSSLTTSSLDRSNNSSSINDQTLKVSTIIFVPTPHIQDFTNYLWIGLEKTGEIICLDMTQLPQISIFDRRTAHQSSITHLLNATLPHPTTPNLTLPEIWSLDDQGGLRVWNGRAHLGSV